MQRIFIWFLLILLLGSCYKNARSPSFNMDIVLPADSMVNLITDLHLADGMINIEQKKDQSLEQISGEYFHTVLQKHQVTLQSFEESMRYYVYHAEELDKIYEKVIVNLSLMESKVLKN